MNDTQSNTYWNYLRLKNNFVVRERLFGYVAKLVKSSDSSYLVQGNGRGDRSHRLIFDKGGVDSSGSSIQLRFHLGRHEGDL